jgi:hypothetical protein
MGSRGVALPFPTAAEKHGLLVPRYRLLMLAVMLATQQRYKQLRDQEASNVVFLNKFN